MRVLLVTEDLPSLQPGGAAAHALMLGRALRAAGHHVEVLGRRGTGAPAVAEGMDGGLHADIDLRGTGWQEHRFGAFLPGRGRHVAWRILRAISARDPQRFDAVHYHGHAHALAAFAPRHWPLVQTVHDQGAECLLRIRLRDGVPCREHEPAACADCAAATEGPGLKGRAPILLPSVVSTWRRALSAAAARTLRRDSERAFSRHATIFVSAFLRRRFLSVVGPSAGLRSTVIHNFTELARLRAAARAVADAPACASPVALTVARLDEGKGVGRWLEALDDATLRRFEVTVVGDGPLREALVERHAPRGVRFLGFLPQAEVDRLTAAAAVCVVPSQAEESFSLATLEALALGRPTLALARGGIPELSRYQRYPGQLRLAGDHGALAGLLAAAGRGLVGPPPATMAAMGESPDVGARLPEILSVYRHAGLGTRPAWPVHGHA